ncbi:MAG: DUF4926 domain-containing protein [Gemmatimonadota bacterium]|jgi:hypothetical protein
MKELELAVLTRDMPEHGLEEGDVGTIVHVYPEAEAYEVEFVTGDGHTVAVLTLEPGDVRPRAGTELLHTRDRG